MPSQISIEQHWITLIAGVELVTTDVRANATTSDDKHVVIEGRFAVEDELDLDDHVEHLSLPLLFGVAALSFADAVPAGNSGEFGFDPNDQLRAEDVLRHLRYRRGELSVYLDYLRGRMIKTTVVVRPDGRFTIDTVNRGEAATRWLEMLQGRMHANAPSSVPALPPRVLN